MLCIVLTVVLSALGVNVLLTFERSVFLLGEELNLTSLAELQWHFYALAFSLAIAPVLIENKHVRVDFIYEKFSLKAQQIIDVLGYLVFALPFLWLCFLPSFSFARRAFIRQEISLDGGLTDRWFIKGMLVGILVFLFLAVLYNLFQKLKRLLHKDLVS